ncbi:MAG: hypothetical protein JWO08_4756, partial [Verrucomicrobiaceae bacterium]|nr:hypothetical protein [Verrucomicrobiaceae bacterium]
DISIVRESPFLLPDVQEKACKHLF